MKEAEVEKRIDKLLSSLKSKIITVKVSYCKTCNAQMTKILDDVPELKELETLGILVESKCRCEEGH